MDPRRLFFPASCEVIEGLEVRMDPTKTPRNLPPAQASVFLVLLWPDGEGSWAGRVKDTRTGVEHPFGELEELLSWLENHQDTHRRSA
ncbi:hypothetical protein [Calidithermus chliarophilus]|uniref:hypothetical protein n=1 Tax=Calidithermus chliarophilus TaxID=52023 RepID=UPI001FDF8760|nr:hypothetical protein [Calidithermus chliarophilus]